MSSFSVIRGNGSVHWAAERLDINIWVLPSILGQQIYYCDLGICAIIEPKPTHGQRLSFELRLPFEPDFAEVLDLMPLIRNDDQLLALVFGSSDLQAKAEPFGRCVKDEPTKDALLLLDLDLSACKALKPSNDRQSRWLISSGDLDGVPAQSRVYVRMRFVTHSPGRLWAWQQSGRWNSHAICDLRVNDFRQSGHDIDFARLATFERVNAFIIASANYKSGRISPAPKYVRILETAAWGDYLKRRLGRSRELFIITYWKRAEDGERVDQSHPFRAFIELERRRPTAAKSTTIGVAVVVVALILLQTPSSLSLSLAWQLGQQFYVWVAGILSVPILLNLARWVFTRLNGASIGRIKKLLAWSESRRYAITR